MIITLHSAFFPAQVEEVYFVKGALERLLRQCQKYYYQGSLLPMTAVQEKAFTYEAARLGTAGLRGNLWFKLISFIVHFFVT